MAMAWRSEDGKEHRPVPCAGLWDDGNAFAILGKARRCLRAAGHREAADQLTAEATSGDYDHLIQTVMRYVDEEAADEEEPGILDFDPIDESGA